MSNWRKLSAAYIVIGSLPPCLSGFGSDIARQFKFSSVYAGARATARSAKKSGLVFNMKAFEHNFVLIGPLIFRDNFLGTY